MANPQPNTAVVTLIDNHGLNRFDLDATAVGNADFSRLDAELTRAFNPHRDRTANRIARARTGVVNAITGGQRSVVVKCPDNSLHVYTMLKLQGVDE